MTPFEVLQWIGVAFTGAMALALGIVAVKAAVAGPSKPKPDSDLDPDVFSSDGKTSDERRQGL